MTTDITNQLVRITTGDGLLYELPYKQSEYTLDFNVSEYDFLNTEGVYVDRLMPRAVRYDLTVYFTGDDNQQNAQVFIESCKDRRMWRVEHPLNGDRNMQPINISIDKTSLSHTAITISLVETITTDGLLIDQDYKQSIEVKTANMSEINEEISAGLIASSTTEVAALKSTAENINQELQNKIDFQDIADEYNSTFAKINATIGSFQSDTLQVLQTVSNMLLQPKRFIDSTQDRLKFIQSQFNQFVNLVAHLPSIYTAQFIGASVISSYANTSVPSGKNTYETAKDVDMVVQSLWNMYEVYVKSLQEQQDVKGFVPDYNLHMSLYELVVYTINKLYFVALDVPMVVTGETTENTSAIILAHQYNMDIEKLFKVNNWSVSNTLIIPKNTPVIYYV